MSSASIAFDSNYLNALRRGDPTIQMHFVNHFSPILLRKLQSQVRYADQARDLRQETFLRVLKAVSSGLGVRKPERFEVFVIGVCNNIVRESYRAQKRAVSLDALEAEPVADLPSPCTKVLAEETCDKVRKMIAQMKPVDRTLLKAVLLDKQDKDEVCRQLGVSRDYLRVLLCRAKKRFRAEVQKETAQHAHLKAPSIELA